MKKKLLYLLLVPLFAAGTQRSTVEDESPEASGTEFRLETPDDGVNPSTVKIGPGNYSKRFTIETALSWRIEKPAKASLAVDGRSRVSPESVKVPEQSMSRRH